MPCALREEVPTALGEDPEGRVMDAGSSPAGSIDRRLAPVVHTREAARLMNGWRHGPPKHALVQHLVPLLGKGHNGDFTLKIGDDSTILGIHEVLDPEDRKSWRLALLVLEDMRSRVVPWHFIVKGVTEKIELPENGAWNCVGNIQSRSGYIWAIFQVWPDS
jgi:hypothetical protein